MCVLYSLRPMDLPALFREPETLDRFGVPICSLVASTRLHLVKNCLLLEHYLLQRPTPLETKIPPYLANTIDCFLAPPPIPDAMPDDYAAMMYIAAPAIGFALQQNPHLELGEYRERARATLDDRAAIAFSVDAMLGNLLLHAMHSNAEDEQLLAYIGHLRRFIGPLQASTTLVAALCAFLKTRSVARRTLDVFATILCHVSDCLCASTSADIEFLLPHYFSTTNVALPHVTSTHLAVCGALFADALGFFAAHAPHRAPLLVRHLCAAIETAAREGYFISVSPAAVLVPLLVDWRWPTLSKTVRDQLATIVRPEVETPAAKAANDAPIIHGLVDATCTCKTCQGLREWLRTSQWRVSLPACLEATQTIADLQAAGFVNVDAKFVTKRMMPGDNEDAKDEYTNPLPSWVPILQARLHLAALCRLS